MPTFTTNWHRYRTHLHPIAAKPQKRNPTTPTDSYTTKQNRSKHTKKTADKQKTTNFEKLLLEAIDEGLSVLGESSKHAIYFYLEKSFKIKKKNIPNRIEEFADALEKIFGTGAKIVEIQIMKCLFNKVGYTFKSYSKQKNLTFIEYIEAVKLEKKKSESINDQQLN
ncbi:MAG: hypothetical protein CW691_11230 [Candidatus Bathyarchaeum sp.]|nr:MAG: hypothetical protein CW691_11230 [Candidatus Bathyarchaeum sp.]